MSALPILPDGTVAEANHRIANNLTMLAAVARLQAVDFRGRPVVPGAECAAALNEVAARVHTIARLHRQLMRGGPDEFDSAEYLTDVCNYAIEPAVLAGQMTFATNFRSSLRIPPDHLGPVGMIVVEAVINAAKHAHPAGVSGHLRACGGPSPNGSAVIEIADDGVGLPDGFDPDKHGGMGLRMMRSLAAQVGADIAFQSRALGLSVRLTLSR